MRKEKEIRLVNELDEVSLLAEFVEDLCDELNIDAETTMNINLALEEAVANVIMYAYPDGERHEMLLKVTSNPSQLVFLLSDNGISFDPTTVEEVDILLPIEERPVGGLGIFLVRRIMNEVTYQRLDGENHLIMRKNID